MSETACLIVAVVAIVAGLVVARVVWWCDRDRILTADLTAAAGPPPVDEEQRRRARALGRRLVAARGGRGEQEVGID